MRRIRSDKTLSLGMPKAPQGNIHRGSKQLSLGMPRKASPLSSPTLSVRGIPSFVSNIIGNLTWSHVFIHHMICVLLGESIHFVSICFLLFIIMFCIFYFNKSGNDSLCHAYFASIHVAVSKQKVYRCCKNFHEKSECAKMLNFFTK